jgi:hypothetical protein
MKPAAQDEKNPPERPTGFVIETSIDGAVVKPPCRSLYIKKSPR